MWRMNKVLLISETVPPMVSSVAVVLGRVFKMFPKGSFAILTGHPANSQYGLYEGGQYLDGEHFYADLPRFLAKRRWTWWLSSFYELLRLPLIVWMGYRIIRPKRIKNIITTTYGGFEIAAYFISELTKTPLYIYLLDAYEEIEQQLIKKLIRYIFARRLFRSAVKIFVMSEPLKELLKERYGVNSIVIPHPVELSKYSITELKESSCGKYKIVYTGMIYDAHRDCFLDLIEAIQDLPNVTLHIYTPRPAAALASEGIYGKKVKVSFMPNDAIPAIQKSADILFLPMSFNSPYPEVIRTASPGKISEYLAAGRPILVYAPAFSYVAQYARSHGFGLVIDQKNTDSLREAIVYLLYREEVKVEMGAKSLETAAFHEVGRVARLLMQEMDLQSEKKYLR